AFARALSGVVARHESLRTVFALAGESPIQVVQAAPAAGDLFPLPLIDVSALPAPRREAELRRLAVEAAGRPFDLAPGPLLRPAVARGGAADHLLLLTQHHIVSDAWSMRLLIAEVSALYGSFLAGAGSQPAAL